MSNIKEREREELHKTIWKIANELRGSVDGWDFKQYVLGLLFYRFISENIENYVNENQRKAGEAGFEYRNLSDKDALNGKSQILEEKGFFILPSELFCNVRKTAKNNDNLNVVIANIFDNIESSARGSASEDDVKGLFDDFDVKGNKLGNTVEERNEKLAKMLDAIGDLKLGDYQDNTIDTFGDAYEFLMTMYASNAGKSGGEFFTPQEVGELLARIVIMDKKEVNKVYDPCCGSGGLLLKFAKILGKENVKQGFFGQEINLTTYNLARINMFLHDINYNNFSIVREDTLIHPAHWDDEPFDAIVSNPPYSIKWAGKSNPILINDERFAPAGVLAPERFSDLAFTMHMVSWLSQKGTAAIVEFPGILHRKGAEQKIRKYLVDNNFVDTIIKLPKDLFFGTTIDTCILVLKKNKTDNSILYIDASEEFERGSNKNKLTDKNIENIIDCYKQRITIDKKSKLVSYDTIKDSSYDLSFDVHFSEEVSEEKIDFKENEKKINDISSDILNLNSKLSELYKEVQSINDNNYTDYLIKDVCKIIRGKRVTKKDLVTDGEYDVISGGMYPMGKINQYNRDKNTITVSQYGTAGFVNWQSNKFWANDVCYSLIPNEKIDNRYFYYYLKNIQNYIYTLKTNAIPAHLPQEKFENIKVSLPDIKAQKIIVEILDKIQLYEDDLEKKYEEMIQLNKNKYKYYMDFILSSEKINEED